MARVTVRMVALTLVALAMTASAASPAMGADTGCDVLGDPRDRASCEARAEAREVARAEVARRLEIDSQAPRPDAAGEHVSSTRSADWQRAVEESRAFDPGALLQPRLVAAVGGLAWFFLVLRSRRRARARDRRRRA